MNIKKSKLGLLLMGISASFVLSSCGEPLPEIQFDDTISFRKETKDYDVALGKRTLYCLVGNYKGVKGGEAVVLDSSTKFRFSVAEALKRNPLLMTQRNLIFARKQQIEFKKRNSPLYDPTMDIELNETTRETNHQAREQQKVRLSR